MGQQDNVTKVLSGLECVQKERNMTECISLLEKEKELCSELRKRQIPDADIQHARIFLQLIEMYKSSMGKPVLKAHEEADICAGSWIRDMIELWID